MLLPLAERVVPTMSQWRKRRRLCAQPDNHATMASSTDRQFVMREPTRRPWLGLIAASLGSDTESKATGSETEGLVRFDSNLSDRELAAILANLLDQGVSVAQFREIPTDLEDAFLSVTSRGGDASPAEMPAAAASSQEPA